MLTIIKQQIAYNITKRLPAHKIEYIVVHYTANTAKGADALTHFKYFNGGNRNASADFFVDDHNILQINDYHKFYTWQCGDGKGKYGITNRNSIGIEMCVNSDGDFNKTLQNTIELVRFLMKELNIDINHVVRHWDASRKLCPVMFCGSVSKDGDWKKFKNALQGYEVILNNCNLTTPQKWIDFVKTNKTGILQYLPAIIEKVYAFGITNSSTTDWKDIVKKCTSNPNDWLLEIPKHQWLSDLVLKIYNN